MTGYRYVKTRDEIVPEPRKATEVNKLYERLIARVALRTLAEAFDVAPTTLVSGIVFNGYVSAKVSLHGAKRAAQASGLVA